MYPRNSASPEPIAIGPVVQISDGAVQTAGVTVRVKPIGVAEADGGGTTAYSTDGVVLYTPTQAETNYTSFVLIAKKTGCIPASVTVVTSASNTTGYAGTDQSKILNPTSTVNLSGTTIKTATDVETDTQDIQTRLPSGLVDGRMASIAQVVGDKTGYKLESDGLSLVTAWAVAITGNITGNLSGSVGSISGVTFPTHFDNLAIAPNGHVTSTVDSINNNAITASSIQANAITSAKIASGAITSAAFASDSITASALATDAVNEIANAVAATQALSRLDSMIESDGAGQFRFDIIALENAPAGGGGGGTDWTANERTAIRSILGIPASGTTPADPSVGILDTIRDGVNSIGINVYPVTSSTPERVNGTTITVYKDEQTNVTISTTATLTGLTLRFVAEDRTGADVLVVENASFVARTATSATLQIPSTLTDEIANYPWTLRDVTTGNSVLARGVLSVQAAASKNA